jgi:hypothetical protein
MKTTTRPTLAAMTDITNLVFSNGWRIPTRVVVRAAQLRDEGRTAGQALARAEAEERMARSAKVAS